MYPLIILKRFCVLFVLFNIVSTSFAQDKKEYELHIDKAKAKIILDGILDENDWSLAAQAEDFFLTKPYDTSYATSQTHIKMLFDDEFLYVSAVVYQPKNAYTTASLKRDFENGSSDIIFINIDTFKDKLNGFHFALSPYNVQREALISIGSEVDNSWDNRWYSEVKNYDDRWVAEIAIPFKTLRYKIVAGQNTWGINFGRNDIKALEVSGWSPIPRNFKSSNLGFEGSLIWDTPPPQPGANVAIIPFVSAGVSQEYPRNVENLSLEKIVKDNSLGTGLDAKIGVTPSLNLDLTINPDFSQVEVDQQQTNLSRFELFFPEKRQFFIENSDLFGTFGFPNTRPFFSRRIGITRNPITGLAAPVPIIAGARLSGKINQDWRIGAMNMQTKRVEFGDDNFLPATNYSVLTLQRKVLQRSTIGAILVNKSNFGLSEDADPNDKSNKVAGLEFNYYSLDNRWQVESYYHQSFTAVNQKGQNSWANYVGYNHPNIELNLGVSRIGENFNPEVGFVPRKGYLSIFRPQTFTLYPKNPSVSKKILSYGLATEGEDIYNLSGKKLDSETALYFFLNTQNKAVLNAGWYWQYTYLFRAFDPSNASDNPNPDLSRNVVPLPIGDYKANGFYISYETPKRNQVFGSADIYRGGYFNGNAVFANASIKVRFQPYVLFSSDVAYTNLQLPDPYNSISYLLFGPKAELTFSKKLFLSTYFQYNTQTNNTNINARLQYRYRAVSDIFLVYTDNYFAQEIGRYKIRPWMPKSRAIVFKMTYWLNV